jgi:UDP-N-acetylmuramyl pentapeptide phosphotransferase/UDP-N-acetylglucosamine-1-phosphate transferase
MNFFGITGLFALSFSLGLGVIFLARRLKFGADSITGVQRAHSHWVPRLGGIPIFLALAAWILVAVQEVLPDPNGGLLWVLCLFPAFAAGLAEDLTQKVGSWPRLVTTMGGAVLAWWLIGAQVQRLGLPLIDGWLAASPLLSLAITALFVGGGAHAINIIDGNNGLASSYALVVLFTILVVAGRVGDIELVHLSVGAIAATLGFFVLNFPRGRLFLGDSGAYLLGTVIGFLLAVLVARHPQVSPMFAAVLLVYPVWELLFSSYRRRVLRGTPAMQPDATHLHTLVYKRLVRSHGGKPSQRRKILMNSATTLYMLAMIVTTAVLALMFWTRTVALLGVFVLFIAGYLALYFSLVRFRAQRQFSMRAIWARSGIELPRGAWLTARIPARARQPKDQPVVSPLATGPSASSTQES